MKRALYATLALFLFLLGGFLYPSGYADATARAKLSEVVLVVSNVKIELAELCAGGKLADAKSLGAEPPARWIRELSVTGADARYAMLRVVTNEIPTDLYIWGFRVWQSVAIPAGSKLVMRLDCPGRDQPARWVLEETDVPARYLPRDAKSPDR